MTSLQLANMGNDMKKIFFTFWFSHFTWTETHRCPIWEMIWKKYSLHFDFHVLLEQRHIGGRIFPVIVFQQKRRFYGKWYEKNILYILIFIFYLNRDTSVVEFSLSLYSNKKDDSLCGPCWPIHLQLKPFLNRWIAVEWAKITFISIHIIANQNSYHEDKSTL